MTDRFKPFSFLIIIHSSYSSFIKLNNIVVLIVRFFVSRVLTSRHGKGQIAEAATLARHQNEELDRRSKYLANMPSQPSIADHPNICFSSCGRFSPKKTEVAMIKSMNMHISINASHDDLGNCLPRMQRQRSWERFQVKVSKIYDYQPSSLSEPLKYIPVSSSTKQMVLLRYQHRFPQAALEPLQ